MNLIEHSNNVLILSMELGKILNLNNKNMNNLAIAARFHDIGKNKIPQTILYKEDKLSEVEWEIIKCHCMLGAEILKKEGFNENIIEGVLYHHERFDGNGYMIGLKGKQIPLISRIISVVDSYDAMVSNRVYRKALGKDEAIEEIEKNLESQFDPKIGSNFINLIRGRFF